MAGVAKSMIIIRVISSHPQFLNGPDVMDLQLSLPYRMMLLLGHAASLTAIPRSRFVLIKALSSLSSFLLHR